MDWTEDAGLHQQFKDWREEVELLLNTVLLYIRNANTKMKIISLWAGKEARTYISTVDRDCKDSLKAIMDTLEDWTRPKSDEIAAFTQLRALNQGNKTLYAYIQEVRRMVDLCNFVCVGDCKDRLIRNSIVAGLSSTKACQQCISKGSSLTLNECIKICQTEDATCRQVQALRPESADCTDSTSIHKIAQYPQQQARPNFRGRGGYRGPLRGSRYNHRGGLWEEPNPGKTSDTVQRLHVNTVAHGPTNQEKKCKASHQECYYCGKLRHFSKVCRHNPDYQNHDKTAIKHIDIEEHPADYTQE